MPRDQPTPDGRPDTPQPAASDRPREHGPTIQSADGTRRLADLELRPDMPSAWHVPGVADHPARPRPDTIRLTPDRLAHILGGDPHGDGGGHRHGTGRPGKTEFPPDWDDDRIAAAVLHTAHRPQEARQQDNGRWRVVRTHDGVAVYAVIQPDGRIWTAYPHPDSPGVTRNPWTNS